VFCSELAIRCQSGVGCREFVIRYRNCSASSETVFAAELAAAGETIFTAELAACSEPVLAADIRLSNA